METPSSTSLKSILLRINVIFFRYSEALISLVKEVLNKMQFLQNQNQLEELNNDIIDDDNETEWQHFLKECIEIIAMVAEIIPLPIFNLVVRFSMFFFFVKLHSGFFSGFRGDRQTNCII